MDKYLCFARVLYRRTERNYPKEIVVGIIVSFVLCILLHLYPSIVFMVTLGYFCMYQITCMFENEIFFSRQELLLFCIEEKKEYTIFYRISRIVRDSIVTSILVFFSAFLLLLINTRYESVLFWTVCWILNLLLSSYSNRIGECAGKNVALGISVILVAIYFMVIYMYIDENQWFLQFFEAKTITSTIYLLGSSIVYVLICEIVGKNSIEFAKVRVLSKKIFGVLRRIDVMIYKDYMLIGSKVAYSLFEIILFIILLGEDSDYRFKILFIMMGISINCFSAKLNKKYLLLAEDELFSERIFIEDRVMLRKSKHRTVLSGIFIKFLLCSVISLYFGVFSPLLLLYSFFVIVISANIEYICIYRNNFVTTLMCEVLKEAMAILACISLLIQKYYTISIMFFVFVLLMYWKMSKKLYRYCEI